MINLPSPNCDERPAGVNMLILHYTGMQTAAAALARLRDPVARVSSHYLVDEDGAVFQLVPEERRAWHAGVSFWRGHRMLNDVSIGIEIVNPGHEWGYRPFPGAQIDAVVALCHAICNRWPIASGHVLGHSDVAPSRKQDPGELFPWPNLAQAGIGLFPDAFPDDTATPDDATLLKEIGYDTDTESLGDLVTAFQRHWRQAEVTGVADPETRRMMRAVVDALNRPG